MKLLLLLLALLFILQGCSNNERNIEGQSKPETIKDNINFSTGVDLEILKLAFDEGAKYCSYAKNRQVCLNILSKQKEYFSKLLCEKMLIYKVRCYDKKNFLEKKCDKIKNKDLQKKCYFEKMYLEAIKNKDKSFCDKLPRIKKKECLERIK